MIWCCNALRVCTASENTASLTDVLSLEHDRLTNRVASSLDLLERSQDVCFCACQRSRRSHRILGWNLPANLYSRLRVQHSRRPVVLGHTVRLRFCHDAPHVLHQRSAQHERSFRHPGHLYCCNWLCHAADGQILSCLDRRSLLCKCSQVLVTWTSSTSVCLQSGICVVSIPCP